MNEIVNKHINKRINVLINKRTDVFFKTDVQLNK